MTAANGVGAKGESFFAPASSVIHANREEISKVMAIVGLVLFVGGMTVCGTRIGDAMSGLPFKIKQCLIGAGLGLTGEIVGLIGACWHCNIQSEKRQAAAQPKPLATELV